MSSRNKKCFLPFCMNTTRNCPEKNFLSVPQAKEKKKQWCDVVGAVLPKTKTVLFCCDDHFEVENDFENFWEIKLMKGNFNIKLRPGVLPHVFRHPKHTVEFAIPSTSSANSVKNDLFVSVSCQTIYPPSATVETQTKLQVRSKNTQCDIRKSNVMNTGSQTDRRKVDMVLSPVLKKRKLLQSNESTPTKASYRKTTSNTSFSSSISSWEKVEKPMANVGTEKDIAQKTIILLIEKFPKRYLGIPKNWYFIIEKICEQTHMTKTEIYICLMKIKLNDSFARLADQFGYSTSQCSKIFKKYIPVLDSLFKSFIFWPDEKLIRRYLPIPFRANYNKVQSIIDCLEVEIEKPSNPLNQSLTWSEYKKANTMKYLVSITPDGFINFISTGYGGRTSDIVIVEKSDYLNILKENCVVMADRGFKGISSLLNRKNCSLIKPPSVSSSKQPSKEDVLEGKRVASLRIHVERLIRRIREFAILKPHAVVNSDLIGYLDSMMGIACALINLQSPLIKDE